MLSLSRVTCMTRIILTRQRQLEYSHHVQAWHDTEMECGVLQVMSLLKLAL
jgi:hypothetical protein